MMLIDFDYIENARNLCNSIAREFSEIECNSRLDTLLDTDIQVCQNFFSAVCANEKEERSLILKPCILRGCNMQVFVDDKDEWGPRLDIWINISNSTILHLNRLIQEWFIEQRDLEYFISRAKDLNFYYDFESGDLGTGNDNKSDLYRALNDENLINNYDEKNNCFSSIEQMQLPVLGRILDSRDDVSLSALDEDMVYRILDDYKTHLSRFRESFDISPNFYHERISKAEKLMGDFKTISHDLYEELGFATLIIDRPNTEIRKIHLEMTTAMGNECKADYFAKVTRSNQYYLNIALSVRVNNPDVLTSLRKRINRLFEVAFEFSESKILYYSPCVIREESFLESHSVFDLAFSSIQQTDYTLPLNSIDFNAVVYRIR